MKNLILVLVIALSSVSFAAKPEKDGPFPHKMAGVWTSQNTPLRIFVKVSTLKTGETAAFVMLIDNYGQPQAIGQTIIDESSESVTVVMTYKNGQTAPLVLSLVTMRSKNGVESRLEVVMQGSSTVFRKSP